MADAALLNKTNLKELTVSGYNYILGARIKNEPKIIKNKILSLNLADQQKAQIKRVDKTRLIIGYSAKRAKKDARNRKRGLQRLKKNLHSAMADWESF